MDFENKRASVEVDVADYDAGALVAALEEDGFVASVNDG